MIYNFVISQVFTKKPNALDEVISHCYRWSDYAVLPDTSKVRYIFCGKPSDDIWFRNMESN